MFTRVVAEIAQALRKVLRCAIWKICHDEALRVRLQKLPIVAVSVEEDAASESTSHLVDAVVPLRSVDLRRDAKVFTDLLRRRMEVIAEGVIRAVFGDVIECTVDDNLSSRW